MDPDAYGSYEFDVDVSKLEEVKDPSEITSIETRLNDAMY